MINAHSVSKISIFIRINVFKNVPLHSIKIKRHAIAMIAQFHARTVHLQLIAYPVSMVFTLIKIGALEVVPKILLFPIKMIQIILFAIYAHQNA